MDTDLTLKGTSPNHWKTNTEPWNSFFLTPEQLVLLIFPKPLNPEGISTLRNLSGEFSDKMFTSEVSREIPEKFMSHKNFREIPFLEMSSHITLNVSPLHEVCIPKGCSSHFQNLFGQERPFKEHFGMIHIRCVLFFNIESSELLKDGKLLHRRNSEVPPPPSGLQAELFPLVSFLFWDESFSERIRSTPWSWIATSSTPRKKLLRKRAAFFVFGKKLDSHFLDKRHIRCPSWSRNEAEQLSPRVGGPRRSLEAWRNHFFSVFLRRGFAASRGWIMLLPSVVRVSDGISWDNVCLHVALSFKMQDHETCQLQHKSQPKPKDVASHVAWLPILF